MKLPSGLAVDFGGTKIAAARIQDGKIRKQVQVRTDGNADMDAQIQAITNLLDQLEISDTDRIGVAITGRVTSQGVWHALNTKTLSKIETVPLQKILSEKFQRSVIVQNDATSAAIGEHLAGAGKNYQSIGFITVSTGVGGGFVLNGTPLRSENGLAGHVGFTTSRIARDICGSGRRQTMESIASGSAIARMAAELGHPSLDAEAVYKTHLAGEAWATGLIRQSAETIAELCANLTAILGLEIILLGGSIGLAKGYLPLVEEYLQTEPKIFQPRITHATLGIEGTFIGVLAS